jgi:HSP20 family molecular chaperone IbpA
MYSLVPRLMRRRDNSALADTENIFNSLWGSFDEIFEDTRYVDKEGNLTYEIECPGFNKDNLSVEIVDGILTVKGERNKGERKQEVFKRLSVGASEDVEAEIKDGILTLTFIAPKKKATKLNIK